MLILSGNKLKVLEISIKKQKKNIKNQLNSRKAFNFQEGKKRKKFKELRTKTDVA